MRQRNDLGYDLDFPTLVPPLTVLAGETVEHPNRLDRLTLVVEDPGSGQQAEDVDGGGGRPLVDVLFEGDDDPADAGDVPRARRRRD
jgi:hypothetical protein